MLNYIENKELPEACFNCQEGDCYNCDTAGEKWILPEIEELRITRKLKEKAITRLQREISIIDKRIAELSAEK